ncbi:BatD family protein, partial [bacterium]|nr:BatD family protein [bacterium]
MKNILMFVAILMAALPFTAKAQSTLSASVDKDQVAFGDYFQLTFTFEGAQGGKNLRPPAFNNFMVLSGPNQSTRMQIINGAVSSSISYTYILQPRDEGKFTIGSASIEAEGKKYQSQPITIEVVKGTAQPRSKRAENETPDIRSQIGNNLMIKAIVDRTKVYQGEQITVSYKVYTRVQILSYNIAKSPAFTGFWSEDLEVPKQIQTTNEMVNGKEYAVGLLRKLALFPQRSGTLSLDPMEIEVTVPIRKQSHDFFDNFFDNSTPVQYKTATDPVTISVQPLPSENIPGGFNGAVGLYQMETHLDKQDVKTNDAVTLRITITGQGNLKLLEPPAISFPADLERFDPKISNSL